MNIFDYLPIKYFRKPPILSCQRPLSPNKRNPEMWFNQHEEYVKQLKNLTDFALKYDLELVPERFKQQALSEATRKTRKSEASRKSEATSALRAYKSEATTHKSEACRDTCYQSWAELPVELKERGIHIWFETLSQPNPYAAERANEYLRAKQQPMPEQELKTEPKPEPEPEPKPEPKINPKKEPITPYSILGLNKNDIMKEDPEHRFTKIKTAYRKMANLKHPDKGGTTEEMMSINSAFAELKKIHVA